MIGGEGMNMMSIWSEAMPPRRSVRELTFRVGEESIKSLIEPGLAQAKVVSRPDSQSTAADSDDLSRDDDVGKDLASALRPFSCRGVSTSTVRSSTPDVDDVWDDFE